MEISLTAISVLLRANGLSAIACPSNTLEKQQTLLVALDYEDECYLLKLHKSNGVKSWEILEPEE
jgi:hypothetical protein